MNEFVSIVKMMGDRGRNSMVSKKGQIWGVKRIILFKVIVILKV